MEYGICLSNECFTKSGTNAFKDVKAKDWFANDVQALYDAGIIRGVTSTKFDPYGTLTRQQAALMLERTLEYLNIEKESYSLNFADADKISDEAKSAVAADVAAIYFRALGKKYL